MPAFGKTAVANAQVFARRDWLRSEALSNVELGVGAAVAGELRWGINYSFGGTVSRARFDAPPTGMVGCLVKPYSHQQFKEQLSAAMQHIAAAN